MQEQASLLFQDELFPGGVTHRSELVFVPLISPGENTIAGISLLILSLGLVFVLHKHLQVRQLLTPSSTNHFDRNYIPVPRNSGL